MTMIRMSNLDDDLRFGGICATSVDRKVAVCAM
jgi:hypothetical protein